MKSTGKQKKCWLLKTELAVLLCVICIWIIKSVTVNIDSTKAAVLKQAVKTSPNSATAHFLIDPNDADAHECLGSAYLTLDHYEEAVEAYKESIRIDPDNVNVTYSPKTRPFFGE